jgi:hypothetical protein
MTGLNRWSTADKLAHDDSALLMRFAHGFVNPGGKWCHLNAVLSAFLTVGLVGRFLVAATAAAGGVLEALHQILDNGGRFEAPGVTKCLQKALVRAQVVAGNYFQDQRDPLDTYEAIVRAIVMEQPDFQRLTCFALSDSRNPVRSFVRISHNDAERAFTNLGDFLGGRLHPVVWPQVLALALEPVDVVARDRPIAIPKMFVTAPTGGMEYELLSFVRRKGAGVAGHCNALLNADIFLLSGKWALVDDDRPVRLVPVARRSETVTDSIRLAFYRAR